MNIFELQNQASVQIRPKCRNISNITLLQPKMQKLTEQIHDHILKQVQLGLVQIPQQSEPLKIRRRLKNKQKDSNTNQQQLMQKLQQRRKQTLQKLLTIEEQERQLRLNKSHSLRKNKRIIGQKSPKVSKQQMNRIKEILNKKKQYDIFLQHQTQIVIQNQRQFKLENHRAHASSIQKLQNIRRQAAYNKIKILKQRKQQRVKAVKQFRTQRNPNNQKYIFEVNKQKYQQKIAEQQKQYQRKLALLKQKLKPNIQQIKLHQAQYLKLKQIKPIKYVDMGISTDDLDKDSVYEIESNKQKAKHKFNYHTNMRIFQENRFAKLLKEEQKERQEIENQRSQLSKQRKIKIKQFQKYVHQKFRPRTVKSRNQTCPEKGQRIKEKNLSHNQMHELGKKYLQIARNLKKSAQDQLIDYNPFRNAQFAQMMAKQKRNKKNSESNSQFQVIVDRFFTKSSSRANQNTKSQANQTDASMDYRFKNKFSKDQKLFQSVKHKLQFLSYIQ